VRACVCRMDDTHGVRWRFAADRYCWVYFFFSLLGLVSQEGMEGRGGGGNLSCAVWRPGVESLWPNVDTAACGTYHKSPFLSGKTAGFLPAVSVCFVEICARKGVRVGVI
jgi:hypothetical protein